MRRATALLLMLCLLPLAGAAQEQVLVPVDAGSQMRYQGQLCLWSWAGLTQVDEATGQTELLAPRPEGLDLTLMYSDGERLFGLDTTRQQLHAVTLADGQLTLGASVPLQHELLEDPREAGALPTQGVLLKDKLYLLYQPQASDGWSRTLLACDLRTGICTTADLPYVQAIAAGGQGSLLYLSLDYRTAANTPDQQDDLPALMAHNPDTGERETLGQLGQPWRPEGMAMAWDPEDNSLLYVADKNLYRRQADGSEAFCGQLMGFHADAGMTVLPLAGGRVSVLLRDGVGLRSTQPVAEVAQRPLTVYGAADVSQREAAAQALGGQVVAFKEGSWGEPFELQQMLQAGTGDIDVLALHSLDDELTRMVDKGYLLDLSQSAVLAQHILRCYPQATAPGQRGQALYLLPVELSSTLLIARPKLFEEAGKPLPRSFDALCGFLDTWSREDMDRLSAYQPWAEQSPRQALLQLAVRTAFAAQAREGEAPSFDTPLMRSLLTAALQADTAPLEYAEGDYSFMNKPPLLQTKNYSLGVLTTSGQFSEEEAEGPLVLPALAGEQPVLPAEVKYLAVYARTPHQQAALKYLEGWVAQLSHENRVMLYPDFDEPLELEGMRDVLARYTGEIAALEQQVAAATGAQKTQLETQLAGKRQQRATQEAMRYHISPQVIAQYRGLMQQAVLADRTLHIGWNQLDIRALLRRLQDGQIDLEQFMMEAEGKLRLMRMEDQ